MNAFETLKLSKALLRTVAEEGFTRPTPLQSSIFSRIHGGQDLVAIAPDGEGKSTAIVLAALNKIKVLEEIAPQVLVLVPDAERVEALLEQFNQFNRNNALRIYGLYTGGGQMDTQVLELTDGVDIVVATPDRARAVYLKLGLNLNKVQLFVVDDVQDMAKLQLPVAELSRGIRKTQRLLFASEMNYHLEKMMDTIFEDEVAVVDVSDVEVEHEYVEQLFYRVPDLEAKLKLLKVLLSDEDVFEKTAVLVNSAETAALIVNSFQEQEKRRLQLSGMESEGIETVDAYSLFLQRPAAKVLLVNTKELSDNSFSAFPAMIHFDAPTDGERFLERAVVSHPDQKEQLSILLVSEAEMPLIQDLQESEDLVFQELELPEDL